MFHNVTNSVEIVIFFEKKHLGKMIFKILNNKDKELRLFYKKL